MTLGRAPARPHREVDLTMSKRKAAEDAPDTDHASRERGTVFHDAHDAPVRALDLDGATSTAAAAPDDDSTHAGAASEEEESGTEAESETEQFTAEDAFHECYVCGAYAGGDAILLEYSNVRPSFAQYFCSDRAGCVARAEERVRVAQAELEFAQGRVALARQRVSL